MKLFDDFEAIKFPEENLILITHGGYLYYIYNPKYSNWEKYKDAGNLELTVSNYPDADKEELTKALGGIFPKKETDIIRHCHPSQLNTGRMIVLLEEDYLNFMSVNEIYDTVLEFLSESDIPYKSYFKLKELFDNASTLNLDNEQVLTQIKELSFSIIGRDINKKKIEIFDGFYGSFCIQPVRVIDFSDTNGIDNVAEMKGVGISIEEDDVNQYLTPFLDKYFDNELEANKKRVEYCREDDEGNEQVEYVSDFEWYSTHNFYTFSTITSLLNDIKDTMDALSSGRKNEYTDKLKEKRGWATNKLIYSKYLSDEEIEEYNNNRPTKDDTEAELIIDFYQRFIYRVEYMIKVGKEKGYNLISFMGP